MPEAPQKLQAERNRRREVKPGVMPGHIAIGEDLAEVLHHDGRP